CSWPENPRGRRFTHALRHRARKYVRPARRSSGGRVEELADEIELIDDVDAHYGQMHPTVARAPGDDAEHHADRDLHEIAHVEALQIDAALDQRIDVVEHESGREQAGEVVTALEEKAIVAIIDADVVGGE